MGNLKRYLLSNHNHNSDVRTLDLRFQGRKEAIASFLLYSGHEATLIETGPTTCIPVLLQELEFMGVPPEQVTSLLLTHIHLDHAGAVGNLMDMFPNATVYVSEIGAPHLVSPEKLIGSATRVYGDDMDKLWGEVRPVPESRIVPMEDGHRLKVADRPVQALYTPGHASHHLAYLLEDTRELFTGDIAGVRLPGTQRVLPPTPPPEFDFEQWIESINKIREVAPSALYLTHYGRKDDVERHLDELRARLESWMNFVLGMAHERLDAEQIAQELQMLAESELSPTVSDPDLRLRFNLVAGYGMDVAGLLRYFAKQRWI